METDCTNRTRSAAVVDFVRRAGFRLIHTQPCRNAFFVHPLFVPRAKPEGSDGR